MQETGERATLRVTVRHRADALCVASMIRAMVDAAGGSARVAPTIATAASELAQNIVSHAPAGGEVTAWIEDGVFVVRATNRGPAVRSRVRGLGRGQASVKRLMDRVDFGSTADGGLVVTASVRLRGGPRPACL